MIGRVPAARDHDQPAAEVAAPALAPETEGVPAAAPLTSAASPAAVLALQRSAGNAFVARALAAGRLAPRISAARSRAVLARQHLQLVSGRYIGDLVGAEANVREDVLGALRRLLQLWSIDVGAYGTEEAAVSAQIANKRLTTADIPATIAALRRNEEQSIAREVANAQLGLTLTGSVVAGGQNAKADVIALQHALHANWNLSNADFTRESAAVSGGPDPVDNAAIAATLRGIAAFKAAHVAGTSRRGGPLAGTAPPAAQGAADRDAAMITPGSQTVTVTVGGVTTTQAAGFQDTVRVGGVDRTYRDDLWQAMDATVGWMHSQTQAMFARPRIQMTAFEAIGDAAKGQVDSCWGTYGAFGRRFHTGTNLFDASARTGDAHDMIRYLVDNQRELGVVRARHNAVHSAGRPETQIAADFKRDYVLHSGNKARLELVDQGWPAINEGGRVSIQPFEGATPAATRRVRWEAFQTMIHEYFHSLNHPNYYRLAGELGGERESVLVEGGASLMTDATWRRIHPSVTSSSASLRAAIEGAPAAFDTSVIPAIEHAHYHPQWEQAKEIERAVGAANFRAAFLTGRVELLGYPQSAPASAAAASAGQTFLVPPTGARTLADVAYLTRTPVEELARLNGIAANAAVRPGQSLVVRGTP